MIPAQADSSLQPVATKLGNLDDLPYIEYCRRVAERFAVNSALPLFTTDVDLWLVYLESFSSETRQHHNCQECKRFIQRYGGLVNIGENGETISALWNLDDCDPESTAAVKNMLVALRRAKVTGVFLTSDNPLGQAVTKKWRHYCVFVNAASPSLYPRNPVQSADQKTAERVQDHGQVLRALDEYNIDNLNRVVELLETDSLFRSERVLGPAKWLRDLSRSRGPNFNNKVWRAIATAPAGFCHPRSSMVGTLLDDLAAGKSFDQAAGAFRAKMSPLQYQRPTAAPSSGQVHAAEKLIADLGIAAALPRRYATIEEVEALWHPAPDTSKAPAGVFGHLLPPSDNGRPLDVAERVITWTKFQRDVLPTATRIDVLCPDRGGYIALITAQDPSAPPILQWDSAERRNPVSWYVYPNGSHASTWNLSANQWAPVTAVCLQPSMWGLWNFTHLGKSAVLIIQGAKDSNYRNTSIGLFPEILRSELHGARSVIEAYSKSARLGGYETASACGLRIGDRGGVGVTSVRVTSATGSRFLYGIDRWD